MLLVIDTSFASAHGSILVYNDRAFINCLGHFLQWMFWHGMCFACLPMSPAKVTGGECSSLGLLTSLVRLMWFISLFIISSCLLCITDSDAVNGVH